MSKNYTKHIVFYYLVDSSPYAVYTCSSEFCINKNKINTCKKCKKKRHNLSDDFTQSYYLITIKIHLIYNANNDTVSIEHFRSFGSSDDPGRRVYVEIFRCVPCILLLYIRRPWVIGNDTCHTEIVTDTNETYIKIDNAPEFVRIAFVSMCVKCTRVFYCTITNLKWTNAINALVTR